MKVRIIRSFQHYEPGQVLDPDLGVADMWIHRGFAEAIVDGTEGATESTMLEHDLERAVIPNSPRHRKVKA